ncbi:hypothetical protein [Amycolatopsis thermoflava]|uniref:hypothetical protein n=1 Tax=Amycolatopsis thermoflava TaxID=84480 RepID=UPI003817CDD8
MSVSTTDVAAELKILRKGRGVSANRLADRVGPALHAVCGISAADNAAVVRQKVSDRLGTLIGALPDDLRTSLLAAFALHEQARHPFYQERVHWAAQTLDRDARTVRRRIDEGIDRLAELAVAGAEPADAPAPSRSWHTEELRVALALDQPVPEAFEFRRVVVDADEIDELDLALTLTSAGPDTTPLRETDLQVDVFYGGVLTGRRMESSDRIGLALRPPGRLRRGDRHDIALRFRAGLRQPHYVCVPRHPCELFDLHIRFARPLPAEVVRLDKAFQDDARDHSARGTPIEPDEAGEVHEQFRHLVPGFAYGVRWRPVAAG